ncbi:hypothetical protein [Natranaerobius trueperi]|uniref:Uncharacterized protein n=1 Tax=Natranaerobius trueperi TaxID=759412 RepID=A0A226C006_9FIRM|nr:hypothetical protein [Natranaerobius trueperi]OWZ84382.1 hypothetical protein CDO51_03725 [Natranaerobius trueperi]
MNMNYKEILLASTLAMITALFLYILVEYFVPISRFIYDYTLVIVLVTWLIIASSVFWLYKNLTKNAGYDPSLDDSKKNYIVHLIVGSTIFTISIVGYKFMWEFIEANLI